MLGVIDVGTDQDQPIADAGPWQMSVVAWHELDHQVAVLLGAVVRHQRAAILRIQPDQDVDVAVFLVAYVLDRARNPAARIADQQAIRVVDAI